MKIALLSLIAISTISANAKADIKIENKILKTYSILVADSTFEENLVLDNENVIGGKVEVLTNLVKIYVNTLPKCFSQPCFADTPLMQEPIILKIQSKTDSGCGEKIIATADFSNAPISGLYKKLELIDYENALCFVPLTDIATAMYTTGSLNPSVPSLTSNLSLKIVETSNPEKLKKMFLMSQKQSRLDVALVKAITNKNVIIADIGLSFDSTNATVTFFLKPNCQPNRPCIRVAFLPVVLTLPVIKVTKDQCDTTYLAKIDNRPVDGDLKQLVIKKSTARCFANNGLRAEFLTESRLLKTQSNISFNLTNAQ
jgi:hypothetical protein